jgi:tol-pal system protein YbgF
MINLRRIFLATLLTTSLTQGPSYSAFAEAPVVDDSENFELFEQQAANKRPVTFKETGFNNPHTDNLDKPLAHEDQAQGLNQTADSASLLNTLQGLQQDIQELRGQLEVQGHELKRLQQQQLDFYKDLDARVSNQKPLQKKSAEPISIDTIPMDNSINANSVTTTPSSPNLSDASDKTTLDKDEKLAYMAAYTLVSHKQFDEALPAIERFIAQYPQGGYTANAHYWAGELYMVRKDYTQAITHFETVLQKFPTSSKSSACLLKIGYALAASGSVNEAQKKLQQVIQQYPDTHAAQLALAKLDSLGHP